MGRAEGTSDGRYLRGSNRRRRTSKTVLSRSVTRAERDRREVSSGTRLTIRVEGLVPGTPSCMSFLRWLGGQQQTGQRCRPCLRQGEIPDRNPDCEDLHLSYQAGAIGFSLSARVLCSAAHREQQALLLEIDRNPFYSSRCWSLHEVRLQYTMSLPRAAIAVSPPTYPIYSRWEAAPVADACGERLPNYHTPLGHPQQADPPHTLSPCCSHARRQPGPKLARSPPLRPRRPRSPPPACRVQPTA